MRYGAIDGRWQRSEVRRQNAEKGGLISDFREKLHPPGAGYGFGQQRMDFFKHAAGFDTVREYLAVQALQAGAFDQMTNFKVELIV